MTRALLFALPASLAFTLPLAAQDAFSGPGSDGFEIDGEITVGFGEIFEPFNSVRRYYDADVDGQLAFGAGFGLGFDIDVNGEFDGTQPQDRYSIYGFYEFAPDQQLRVGFMPGAADMLLIDDFMVIGEGDIRFLTASQQSLATAQNFAEFDEIPFALGYAADYGAISTSATVHFNRVGDGELYGLAARYDGSAANGLEYHVGVGLEVLNSDTADLDPAVWIAGGIRYDALSVDLVYGRTNTFFSQQADSLSISTRYALPQVSGLSLGAEYARVELPAGSFWGAGIGAEYEHSSGFGLSGSFLRTSDVGAEANAVQIEAFFRF